MPNAPVFDAALDALRDVRYAAAVPVFIEPQRAYKLAETQAS